jgi:hypothetical protein
VGHATLVDACPIGITVAFLDDPLSQPDGSCTESMPGPDWFLPGDELDLGE